MTATAALITGFPRLVARGLAVRLLNLTPEVRITLLVDPDHVEEVPAFLAELPPDQRPRVRALTGRVTDVDLGLSGADITELLSDVTHVFHADTRGRGPFDVLKRHNVGGTRKLVQLTRDMTRLKRLLVVSTAFVSGDRTGVVLEEELATGQGFNTAYERSMFRAERLLREAMPRLPITVVRPSALIGHSRTGQADGLEDGPAYLVRLLVTLPVDVPLLLPGRGGVPLNLVPVDYVVQATCALALAPEAVGRTFHLVDPNPLSARQVFEILSDVTARPAPVISGVPAGLMRRALGVPGLKGLTRDPRALLSVMSRPVTYHCGGALELLARTGIACPPFESYADQLCVWAEGFARSQKANAGAPAFAEDDV